MIAATGETQTAVGAQSGAPHVAVVALQLGGPRAGTRVPYANHVPGAPVNKLLTHVSPIALSPTRELGK